MSTDQQPGDGVASPAEGQRVQISVDDSKMVTAYANFCRVTGTPEELIIDFGLNPQPHGGAPIQINQRVIMNFYSAKRVLFALNQTIARHEETFGQLETNVEKRVKKSEG